jgi:hypothetical protein
MNIQNIAALVEQVQSLGFENVGYSILKRICFKPVNFVLSQKIAKGKEYLNFHLYFEKESKMETYALKFYDAILQKEMSLSNAVVNEIDVTSLEKRMAEIDWKMVFDFETKKQWNAEDKTSWEKELKIESIIEGFTLLEVTEEGKAIATNLKLKYWAGIAYQDLLGNVTPLKNKAEVSQRFYFFEGQAGISVDEAYRFLQNRWLEKQMQAKRKQPDESVSEQTGSAASANGSGLLRKKRIGTKARKLRIES